MEMTEIKDRIAHIIRAKTLTAAEFANQIGIQPSNVSHLLSGRNNPSLEFVKKLKETFPEYNIEWLIFGKGPITISEPLTGLTPASVKMPQLNQEVGDFAIGQDVFDSSIQLKDQNEVIPHSDAKIKKIVIVFADNTFEVLMPR